MNAGPYWVYALGGVAGFVASLVAAYEIVRRLPGTTRKTNTETVEVNVRIASELRDDAVADRALAREELAQLRKDFDAYRKDTTSQLDELRNKLTGEVNEKEALAQENAALVSRVEELETEVARLKAATTPSRKRGTP